MKQVIEDQSIQNISDACSQSNKGRNYLVLKEKWKIEPYFYLLDQYAAHNIFKYRTANHRLPVETGKFFLYLSKVIKIVKTENFQRTNSVGKKR